LDQSRAPPPDTKGRKKKVAETPEHHRISKQEFYRNLIGAVDPAMYAGEGFSATDEIAKKSDIKDNPWLRGMVGKEGDEWPGPDLPRGKR
jgi:hypothetical protein